LSSDDPEREGLDRANAFDLIELDGDDLRREPLDVRKATLRSLLIKTGPACDETSTSRAMARPSSATSANSAYTNPQIE
jgi:ATP-dependent DNA ligase